MPGGRPTKLTKGLIAKAREYRKDWRLIDQSVVPTKEGLALHMGVNRSSLYEWANDSTQLNIEFSDIFDDIMSAQGRTLVARGLDGTFNSTITKLMMSKHDYVEQTKQDLTTNGKDLPVPILGGITQKEGE